MIKLIRPLSIGGLAAVFALVLGTGCTTPQGQAPAVVEKPELETDWAPFVKNHYPNWRQHYWVDRGNWGNRGYLMQTSVSTVTNQPPLEAQITPLAPLPPLPAEPPTIVPAEPVKVETPAQPTEYTVKKGDSLWRIAGKVYGNPLKWPRIYKANKEKIKHANKIYPGQVLTIPQD